MTSLLTTLLKNPLGLIAVAAPLIVKSIDDNRAKLEADAKLYDKEIALSTELAMEVTSAVDRVVHLNREAVFGIVFRQLNFQTIGKMDPSEPDRIAWEKYQEELSSWNSNRTGRLVRISATFTAGTARIFSGLIDQVEILENLANAAFFDRRQSRYFVNNTVKDTGPQNDLEPGNVDFLIDLLKIDRNELPGLVDTIENFGKTGKDTPVSHRTDFRVKHTPIFVNCEKELMEIGALMLKQIRFEQVGALRDRYDAPQQGRR